MSYDSFINEIIASRGRFGCGSEYHERHHIKPKCVGGSNDTDNLIDLFAQEHFIAHKLLAEENPDNIGLVRAYSAMAFLCNDFEQRYELSPSEYEEARKHFSITMKDFLKDKTNHPSYGKHISDERKLIISKANKGNKYCVGRVVSEATRRKISEANKNPSLEKRARMSQAQTGKNAYGKNPRAKKVIRNSDGKIYSCIKEAAEDNGYVFSTFRTLVRKGQVDFSYYKD